MTLRLGVLVCDRLAPEVAAVGGQYDALYAALVAAGGSDGVEVVPHLVHQGDLPPSPTACDAWLIGGSRHSVYDELDWILELRRFTRRLLAGEAPIVGICFGHQLLAQELGAPVGAADRGWSLGAVDYRLVSEPPGEAGEPTAITLAAIHRDQAATLPDGAELLLTSEAAPVAGFTVGERILTVQAHPEFTADVARRLYRARAELLGPDAAASAGASLDDRPLEGARVGSWIAAFVGEGSDAVRS